MLFSFSESPSRSISLRLSILAPKFFVPLMCSSFAPYSSRVSGYRSTLSLACYVFLYARFLWLVNTLSRFPSSICFNSLSTSVIARNSWSVIWYVCTSMISYSSKRWLDPFDWWWLLSVCYYCLCVSRALS